jgi:hypothetical protein
MAEFLGVRALGKGARLDAKHPPSGDLCALDHGLKLGKQTSEIVLVHGPGPVRGRLLADANKLHPKDEIVRLLIFARPSLRTASRSDSDRH